MLNKKDPLIESVQKIMLENEIRRTVTKNLNEELGIQSINNLPHELHEKYTAILEQNITAALLGEKVEMTKKQFANLDGKPEFTGRDLELARAGHHKKLAAAGKLEEVKTDPFAEKDAGHDVVTPVEPTVNREGKGNNLAPGMARAENIAKQGNSVVTRTGKNSSSVSPSTMKEDYDPEEADKRKRAKKASKETHSTVERWMYNKLADQFGKKAVTGMDEEITGKTDIGDAIRDFRASRSKQLAGRSPEGRRQAAIAAVLQARREKK
jgi:hypothetical protein